jgi:hypothetical protein
MKNFNELENTILRHRGQADVISPILYDATRYKEKLDWQLDRFLADHCGGITGINKTDLDTTEPVYRYFNHKCTQYEQVERLIRVANAYL